MATLPIVPTELANHFINEIRAHAGANSFAVSYANAATGKDANDGSNTWHRAYTNGFAKIAAAVSGRMML